MKESRIMKEAIKQKITETLLLIFLFVPIAATAGIVVDSKLMSSVCEASKSIAGLNANELLALSAVSANLLVLALVMILLKRSAK